MQGVYDGLHLFTASTALACLADVEGDDCGSGTLSQLYELQDVGTNIVAAISDPSDCIPFLHPVSYSMAECRNVLKAFPDRILGCQQSNYCIGRPEVRGMVRAS